MVARRALLLATLGAVLAWSARARGMLVAIDAGHGGRDPGAVRDGVVEKDVTLDMARRLARALAAQGVDSVLVRDDDRFIALQARVAAARAAGARALISLHADAVAQPVVAGASVYTPSGPVDPRAPTGLDAALIAPGESADVAAFMADLSRADALSASARLGRALLASLGEAAPLLDGRPLRRARFRVLEAPDMASALIELGFLSNPADRARLSDPAHRARLADAMAAAIAAWAAPHGRDPAAIHPEKP